MTAWLRPRVRTDASGLGDRPGVYVTGDLVDAPTLKAAIQDGCKVGEAVHAALGPEAQVVDGVDVVVIGAGPAGIAAAATLRDRGRRVIVIDRAEPFDTIARFPAGKVLYAEPRGVDVHPLLAFGDGPAHQLLATWRERLHASGLDVRTPVHARGIDGSDGALVVRTSDGPLPARKVIVAVGRRGTPRRLDVPGADHAHIHDALDDPHRYEGQDVVVIGGGDAAVEAALALRAAGARPTLVHRQATFSRLRKRNRAELQAARAAGLPVIAPARVASIGDRHVTLDALGDSTGFGAGSAGVSQTLPATQVFALLGADLPADWLARVGLRFDGDRAAELARLPLILLFAAFVWCFYVLKQHRELLPFAGPLAGVHDALRVAVPWLPTADGSVRVLDAGFFGTLLYTLAIAGGALLAIRRHRSPEQRRRYASLVAFQGVALFGIPEILAPIVTSTPGKVYSLGVPWPLSIWSLAHEPAAWGWLAAGALVSFVAIPLYVRRNGEGFCSWMCGCGGLAETVGDVFRWRAPRGDLAKTAEWASVGVLLCAIPVTLLVLNDLWGIVGHRTWLDERVDLTTITTDIPAPGAYVELPVDARPAAPEEGDMHVASAGIVDGTLLLYVEKFDWDGAWHKNGWIRSLELDDGRVVYPEAIGPGQYRLPLPAGEAASIRVLATGSSLSRATDFARNWYSLVVDFALASVIGVAFYPLLGNRVWCRFFCPLRAYMELISKRIGRLAIVADERCISCGACTRDCQMGIDVQTFAEQQIRLDNTNSACIQCGICVEVCPMGTLKLDR